MVEVVEAVEVDSILAEKIRAKEASIGVVGLGYTGLPLAVEFAKAGFSVTGIDIDADRVNGVQSGRSYLEDVDNEDIRALVDGGSLVATADFGVVADLDVISICVPTPLTKSREPELKHVISADTALAEHLRPNQLIVLESTTYPGTTAEIVKPILEETGMTVGKDFYLGYSPERVDPGNKNYDIKNTPKIISGYTDVCRRHMELIYNEIVDRTVSVSSTGAAELAKLFENIFRNVNIALVNELAMICDRLGLNVWEVIDASATKPFGFMKFVPGPGLGGHCIPVDPFYLSWKARQHHLNTEFIELAGKINQSMPAYVVTKIVDGLNSQKKSLNSSKVLLLGAAYKKDISDVRESPVYDLIALLDEKQADVSYHDPYVPVLPLSDREIQSTPLTDEVIRGSDCVVIVTDHSGIDYQDLAAKAALVVDTRNALAGAGGPHIFNI